MVAMNRTKFNGRFFWARIVSGSGGARGVCRYRGYNVLTRSGVKAMSYWTKSALQRDCGVSRYQIDKLLGLGLPHEVVGTGRNAEVRMEKRPALSWLIHFVLDAQNDERATPELTRERTRLARAQADEQEMKNAVARGELLPAADVLRDLELANAALRDRVMAVKNTMPIIRERIHAGDEAGADETLERALFDALEDAGRLEFIEEVPENAAS
jgi:hypothetical protein